MKSLRVGHRLQRISRDLSLALGLIACPWLVYGGQQSQTITATPATQTIYQNQYAYFTASGGNTIYNWSGATAYTNTMARWFFSDFGTFPVSVYAQSSSTYAQSSTVTLSVTVLEALSQTITGSPASQTIYQNQYGNFSASGSNTGYVWSTVVGYPNANSPNAHLNFGTPGNYVIHVYAPNTWPVSGPAYKQSNTVDLPITVLGPLAQVITATPALQNVSVGQIANFSAAGSATGYTWPAGVSTVQNTGGAKAYGVWNTPNTYLVTVQAPNTWPASGPAYQASNKVVLKVVVEAGTTGVGKGAAGFLASRFGQPLPKVGGPVEVPTGAESFNRPLFHFHGARDWDFTISYNSILASAQTQVGSMGYGWTFPYEASVAKAASNLIVHWDATHSNTFTPVTGATGTFSSADEIAQYDNLTTNAAGGWTLTRPDQSSLTFDANGRLISDRDPHGRQLALAYDGNGKLITITEPVSGAALSLSYNGSGLLSGLADAAGGSVAFTYQNSLLASVSNQNGKQTTFTYDANRQLLTLKDNAGTALTTDTYTSSGCVATQQDAVSGHGTMQLTYQQSNVASNIVTTVKDKTGATWTYTSDANYHLISRTDPLNETTTFTYDTAGNRLSQTDPLGHTTTYAYDGFGNLTSITDPAGGVTSYTYDARNNLLSTSDPLGNATTRTYDANNNLLTLTDPLGQTTTWTYDSNSLPLTKRLPRGGTFNYSYTNGRLTQVTDPDGVIETFSYDNDGRLAYKQDSAGNRTSYTYDAIGNLLSTSDPLGRVTTSSYDARNRLTATTDPTGAVTAYTYDSNNNLLTRTDALGHATTFAYDAEDRLLSETDPLGHALSHTYDAAGQIVSTSSGAGNTTTYQHDAAGHRTQVTDALGHAATITYDARGLPLTVTDPLGRSTSFSYDADGRKLSVTDALNRTTSLSYDAAGHLVHVTDPAGLSTAQSFDGDGNRTALTDANGNSITFAFDSGDRLTSATTPGGRVTAYGYDSRGLSATETLPSGHVSTVSHDAGGQATGLTDGAGAITFTRDSDGRILNVIEGSQTLARTYDSVGRVTQFTDATGHSIGYAYDNSGRLTGITYPDGKVVSYAYDAANRLTTVTDWASRTTTYAYDSNGHLTQMSRPNGTVQTRAYDAAGQLTGLSELGNGGAVLFAENLSYDSGARIVGDTLAPSQSTGPAAITQTLAYDPSDRLLSWQDSSGNQSSYAFDSATNLVSASNQFTPPVAFNGQTSETFDSDNRLLTFAGQSDTFDSDGNLLAMPGGAPASFTYDARNRLTAADAFSYAYDSENHRTASTGPSGTTQYVVNPQAGSSQVLVRTAPDGTVTDYVYGLGLLYEDAGGTARYYGYNHRGDTVVLTDSTGALIGQVSYASYGEVIGSSGQTITPFLFDGFHGVITDGNGLTYHRSRYFSPQLRRFLNQDINLGSVALAASLNRYAYGNGDPFGQIDPFGQMATDIDPGGWNLAPLLPIEDAFLDILAQGEKDVAVGAWLVTHPLLSPLQEAFAWVDQQADEWEPGTGHIIDTALFAAIVATGQEEMIPEGMSTPAGAAGPVTEELPVQSQMLQQQMAKASTAAPGLGNVGGGAATAESALTQAERYLGAGYKEISPGVYRSADDLRQFRMSTKDLIDPVQGPHVHFEAIGPDGKTIIENAHVRITNP